MTGKPGNSTQEQELLRAVALWAADCAERALPIFERQHPADPRPREAIQAGRAFGQGRRRDQHLRVVAMAALRAGRDADAPAKYTARAATLAAAVAYTHTDLQTGLQGVRQAQHILGPAVYAALALETDAGGDPAIGDEFIQGATAAAPAEVRALLRHMPPQPEGDNRLGQLFFALDADLRG